MAPLFADGHACEFLVARLEVDGAVMRLEITADYGGNPLIADAAEAEVAVRGILRVRRGTELHALEALAPLRMERRSEWDEDAPMAFAPAPDGLPHELVSGVWEWRTGAVSEAVMLAVPEGNLHDVLLWTRGDPLPGRRAQWMMLIEGESSPVIRLQRPVPELPRGGPTASAVGWPWLLPGMAALGLLLAGGMKWLRRLR
jgi:hypothetical protein